MKAEKTPPTEMSSPPDSDLQGEGEGEATRPHRDEVDTFFHISCGAR